MLIKTIRKNLLWSNSNATEDDIIESLKIAHAYELVMDLPLKLDTYVGERGLELSGGERQRIVISRMVFFKDEEEFVDQKKLRQKTGSGKEIMARDLESKKKMEKFLDLVKRFY